MKRTELRRSDGSARLTVKTRKCKACRAPFVLANSWQTHCRAEACAVSAAEANAAKRAKAEAREHRKKLAESKPLQHWLKLTEGVVNHLVQVRDKGLPCISCGTTTTVQWEAGHWLSVGSHPELRYDLTNINLQCHSCNVQKSGNQAMYRIGLVRKWGSAAVHRLEGPHPPAKFTRDQLALIRKEAAAETRRLLKANT